MFFSKTLKEILINESKGGPAKSDPIEIRQVNAGLSRIPLGEFLQYSDFDNDLMINLVGDEIRVGFGYRLGSYSIVNDEVARKLELLYKTLPVDSVVQHCEHANDNIKPPLRLWYDWQSKYCQDPTVSKMNQYRYQFLLASATRAIHKRSNLKTRNIDRYCFITIPYKGLTGSAAEVRHFLEKTRQVRDQVTAIFSSASLFPVVMNRTDSINLLRKLVNPHITYSDLVSLNSLKSDTRLGITENLADHIVLRNTSVEIQDGGELLFSSGHQNDVTASVLTVDKYPDSTHLGSFGKLTGNIGNRDERISQPYFLYTNVHVFDKDKAKESVEISMAWLGKQTREGSEWLRNAMPHLYERSANCKEFLKDIQSQTPVRVYTGIILYSTPAEAKMDAESLRADWESKGFSISNERHISFPVWLASLPWQYMPEWDKPRHGLSRARLAKSINAASLQPIVGDWKGKIPMLKEDQQGQPYYYSNGIPLITGRGEIAYFDPFASESNYNFTIIATSGAGKSYLANDIVRDIRSRDGLVYIFDMGGSYADQCELAGGASLDFKIDQPVSINHFWGIDTEREFKEMAELFAESLITMAFPESRPSNIQIQSLRRGIYEAWQLHGTAFGVREIFSYFKTGVAQQTDSSDAAEKQYIDTLSEISLLLYNYALGTDSTWFNGEPEIDLSNPFTLLELNELENVPSLKSIVFTTIIMLVTRRIYSSKRSTPKIILIDEAWNLLADDRAGPFIEKAFRTIRKFFGAAGIITQSCSDVDMSSASKAAFANSAWRIFLMQRSDSVQYARKNAFFSERTDQVCDIMANLNRMDNYSELLIEHQGQYSPYRFFVDPYSSYCYSSKAQDNAYIEKICKERGVSKDVAIEIAAGFKQ